MFAHQRFLKIAPGLCLSIVLLSSLALSPSLAAQSYVLVDLTAETGEDSGDALDVNDDHTVIGRSDGWPARWERTAGQWSLELLPPGGLFVKPLAVNNAGTAVGFFSDVHMLDLPIVWEDDDYEIVFELEYAWFYDINTSGQIVGRRWGPGALLWENGKVTYLGGYVALGINDLSQVVGFTRDLDLDVNSAVLWQDIEGEWQVTELGTLGGTSSGAWSINDESQIVGWAEIPGDLRHAFLWEDGVMLDLGTLGGSESRAFGVNKLGQVAGWAMTAEEEYRAFFWQDGVMTDLNDLIVSETDLVLTTARAINDEGTIVGRGRAPDGVAHAYFARPLRVGDINLDAFVDAVDLASLLGSWGPCADCGNCPADLDNDCTVGPLDLAILLGNWG